MPLRRAYEFLVRTLEIDAVVLIDGGIDSLLRGDETSLGTPAEDYASLAAVHSLPVAMKILACIDFGAELRDGICHGQVLERVAEVAAAGGLPGMWPLVASTVAAQRYVDGASYIADRQRHQHGSHIHSVVRWSLDGTFGARGGHVCVSPLASVYWFFSARAVAESNLILEHIQETRTLWEIAAMIEAVRKTITINCGAAFRYSEHLLNRSEVDLQPRPDGIGPVQNGITVIVEFSQRVEAVGGCRTRPQWRCGSKQFRTAVDAAIRVAVEHENGSALPESCRHGPFSRLIRIGLHGWP